MYGSTNEFFDERGFHALFGTFGGDHTVVAS